MAFCSIGKLKFLLLGLTKLSTFASMFGFIAVYWSIHGWPLAVGLAGSIYIHEMGHVAMLRRLGIQAGAPLFIPGVGALVMLKEHVTDPIVDARIGLAGDDSDVELSPWRKRSSFAPMAPAIPSASRSRTSRA